MQSVRMLPIAVAVVLASSLAGMTPLGADPRNFDVDWAGVPDEMDRSASAPSLLRTVLPDDQAEDAAVVLVHVAPATHVSPPVMPAAPRSIIIPGSAVPGTVYDNGNGTSTVVIPGGGSQVIPTPR